MFNKLWARVGKLWDFFRPDEGTGVIKHNCDSMAAIRLHAAELVDAVQSRYAQCVTAGTRDETEEIKALVRYVVRELESVVDLR